MLGDFLREREQRPSVARRWPWRVRTNLAFGWQGSDGWGAYDAVHVVWDTSRAKGEVQNTRLPLRRSPGRASIGSSRRSGRPLLQLLLRLFTSTPTTSRQQVLSQLARPLPLTCSPTHPLLGRRHRSRFEWPHHRRCTDLGGALTASCSCYSLLPSRKLYALEPLLWCLMRWGTNDQLRLAQKVSGFSLHCKTTEQGLTSALQISTLSLVSLQGEWLMPGKGPTNEG